MVCSAWTSALAGDDRIDAHVRHRGVRAAAGQHDLENVEARPSSGRACTANSPTGMPGQLCRPYTASHGKRSNRPSSTIARPPPSFSSAGWKMNCTVPSKRRVLGQVARRAEQHGGVAVVAAGVHAAVVAASGARTRSSRGWAARPCRRAGRWRGDRAGAQHADDAGAAEAAMHFEPERREPVGDQRRACALPRRRFPDGRGGRGATPSCRRAAVRGVERRPWRDCTAVAAGVR